jgi:RNA polymerase sigma-70 factor, ECF subfamily
VQQHEQQWVSWMRAAMGGDRAAYDRLLHALASVLRPVVRRGLIRAGRETADTEDIVQEVLLAVHLKRHTWDPDLPLGPWVRAIARHKLIDALRRRGSRYDVPVDLFAETLANQEAEPSVSARDMEKYLGMLPAGQSAVVRTIAIEGVSISETATRLRMTQGAVRVALHRGLTTLAKKLS